MKILRLLQNSVGILFVWVLVMIVDKRLITPKQLFKYVDTAYKFHYEGR